ncbi:hypothetical protein OH492_16820 [Vibrio chagasii]|nr:hypothetical protein [Vibrio chagasii]
MKSRNRYKGLQAHHTKIKFAVSGRTRECAEAQSKDIGVTPQIKVGTCTFVVMAACARVMLTYSRPT